MKNLLCKIGLILTLILLLSTSVNAATLLWDSSDCGETLEGILLYYGVVGEAPTEKDVGNVTSFDLDGLDFKIGVRYEFFLKAYDNLGQKSPESDHLRWSCTAPPKIIEMCGAPITILIKH